MPLRVRLGASCARPAGTAAQSAVNGTEAMPRIDEATPAPMRPLFAGLGPHGERPASPEVVGLSPEALQRARDGAYRIAVVLHTTISDWSKRQLAGIRAGLAEAGAADTPGGSRMTGDHRRILATGIARLRAKIKYRPVVFELMAREFTLLQLQRTVEALAGRLLHKQNFRRLIELQELVEETGAMATATGGRPAKLYRFRRGVLVEREVTGTKLPLAGG